MDTFVFFSKINDLKIQVYAKSIDKSSGASSQPQYRWLRHEERDCSNGTRRASQRRQCSQSGCELSPQYR